MDEKIDLRLRTTHKALMENRLPRGAFPQAGVSVPKGTRAGPELAVIVEFTGPIAPLEAAGLRVVARADNFVTGRIAPAQLSGLAAVQGVVRIEGDGPMQAETTLAIPEARGDKVNQAPGVGTPPTVYTGNGVIVGMIDSGIDFRHEAFRRADGTSRLLAIWDQGLIPAGGEASPRPYGYGVEYNRTAINGVLAGTSPAGTVRHSDDEGHGTHTAGIAAGGGASFPGMATGADIIVVKSDLSLDPTNPTKIRTLEALKYILDMADGLRRPVVVSQSQSFLQGPHDGTTAMEGFIAKTMGKPGQAYVASAGNRAHENVHNEATIPAGGSVAMTFSVTNPQAEVLAEVWYRTGDLLSVTLTTPAGAAHGPQPQPAAAGQKIDTVATVGGTTIDFARQTDVPANHHNLIQLVLRNAAGVQTGSWRITLANPGTRPVQVHSWVERSGGNVVFVGATNGAGLTVSTPATSREVIGVGSYISRTSSPATLGQISRFSGRGPTLDGRIKPDLAAPGESLVAAMPRNDTDPNHVVFAGAMPNRYTPKGGTSMSTPLVAGTVACLLQRRPTLTQEQIRNGLTRTARADTQTGAVPNNTWGYGKLDAKVLLEFDFSAAATRTWVRVRSALYNWTEGATPPAFEVISNENGRAVIELAWGSRDIPVPPALDPAAPLRYYNTGERFKHNVTKADGSTLALDIPEQEISLRDNRAVWTMPQPLWDAYKEELKKARKTPPASQMKPMLYYRVRFEPTGAPAAVIWPDDSSFNASANHNRMNIIALNVSPSTQVVPDREAVEAMPALRTELEWMWANLPANNADKVALTALFSHRFFTNSVEKEVRGKILSLWMQAGPARQRVHTLLDRMFRLSAGAETTVLKQPSIRDSTMLIDHLLALVKIVPHPDMTGVRVAEQLLDDVLSEIMDPNGQVNQGLASTCAPTGIQTLLLNTNASEYARLMRGLLSSTGEVRLANGDTISPPPGIFRAANYAGAPSSAFFVRTNSELAFQATILKYALGNDFPRYDPDAPPNDPRGINTVFQATISRGIDFGQIKRTLEALFGKNYKQNTQDNPSDALRTALLTAMQSSRDPLLTILNWPKSTGAKSLHAVVALRSEGGRIFFKNPQYAGSRVPPSMVQNSTVQNPPRRLDDPRQALESMGDSDLSAWVRGFYMPA